MGVLFDIILGVLLGPFRGPCRGHFWLRPGLPFGIRFGAPFASKHRQTKRFWCFGGFGKGLNSGHVPAPFQGTFLVIILVRFGDNLLTASLGVATTGFHVKLGFELSQ